MKIGVNARFLGKPFTGIGQYTKNLFGELAKLDFENEYILVISEAVSKNLMNSFSTNVKFKLLPEKKIGTAGMKKTWWEQIQLPTFFLKQKVQVAIFPYPSNPWTKDWYKKSIKTIVTVHDCIPWTNKNYRLGLLSKMYHAQTRRAVASANLALTVSKSSKKEIQDICKVESKKIKVIYNDADEFYKKNSNKNAVRTLKKFKLKSRKFFLYVGGYDERKNVKFLIEEFLKFSKKYKDIYLVLAGERLFKNKLYGSFENGAKNIIKTGFLDMQQLADLYRNCLAFVNLSCQEGFNITILEAANCGAPLILSDIAVHREIAGEAAVFVDIERPGECAQAMEAMINKKLREDFQRKSSLLPKRYSWKNSARKLRDVILF